MTDPDPWRCATCTTHHPVPSLARRCEETHRQEEAERDE